MRISTFEYSGRKRIVVEHGPDSRGNGCLLTTQLSPDRGLRSFHPGKMMESAEVVGLKRLYYLFRYKVGL